MAKLKLSASERTELALEIADGRLVVVDLTDVQAAALARAAVSSMRRERQGRRPNPNTAPADRLAAAWGRTPTEDRKAFVRQAGPDVVFDVIAAAL